MLSPVSGPPSSTGVQLQAPWKAHVVCEAAHGASWASVMGPRIKKTGTRIEVVARDPMMSFGRA